MGTKGEDRSISWTLLNKFSVSGPSNKHHNWEYFPPVPRGILRHNLHCGAHKEGHSPRKLENPGRGATRDFYAGKMHSYKRVEY